MVRVYLKEACGAMLVYDVTKRESFDRLPEWVAHVQKANIPSVIVGASTPHTRCYISPVTIPLMSDAAWV